MSKFVLYLYDVLGRHRLVRWTSLVATTVVLLVLMSGQTYREDIADFLPLSDGQEETFREYLESSGAQCVFVIFSDTAGNYEEATDLYCDILDEEDTIHHADYVIANETTVVVESPYGANETARNGRLVEMLEAIGDSVSNKYPDVDIRLTGGPVIAVGNAKQIKTDSIYSVSLAGVLILLLLWIAFRSVRHLTLIAVSIAWGWLFAMGCLSLVHHDVSIIVIGISSVILGIAVNYPLHLIAHLSHTGNADPTLTLEEREVESGGCYHEEKRVDSMRTALKEIVMPLVVVNVTTVGAFLTLVPPNSVA
jgi:predicted RND superfamily exporter protein